MTDSDSIMYHAIEQPYCVGMRHNLFEAVAKVTAGDVGAAADASTIGTMYTSSGRDSNSRHWESDINDLVPFPTTRFMTTSREPVLTKKKQKLKKMMFN